MKKQSLKVPNEMQQRFDAIVALTDRFSEEKLNQEYKELARALTAKLCRKRNTPLNSGSDKVWACAIIHALGMVNFLYDSNTQPYVSNTELVEWFDVGKSTASGKSKQIREMLNMSQLDCEWMLPSQMEHFSPIWYVMVNGFIEDIRTMPLEVQEIALAKGLIPYLPKRNGDENA